jgi:surface antigen
MKLNSKETLLAVLIAGLSLTSTASIAAPTTGTWSFLKDTPAEYFTKEDWTIFKSAVEETLNDAVEGSSKTWKNPKTNSYGEITVLRDLNSNVHDCRLLQISNHAKDRQKTSKQFFCLQSDGLWKLTSPKSLQQ